MALGTSTYHHHEFVKGELPTLVLVEFGNAFLNLGHGSTGAPAGHLHSFVDMHKHFCAAITGFSAAITGFSSAPSGMRPLMH